MTRWGAYRGTKYRSVWTKCAQGNMHQSGLEARRCDELHVMQAGGLIVDLDAHPQPRFDLAVNGVDVCDYHADFRYRDVQSNRVVVEDAKGMRTREYEIKRRLMLAIHGIDVQEIRSARGAR